MVTKCDEQVNMEVAAVVSGADMCHMAKLGSFHCFLFFKPQRYPGVIAQCIRKPRLKRD